MYFMISRIAYSPHGVKNQPVVSLTYGQLFDRNWNEVKNINLLVPSNDPSKNGGHDSFRIISFPYFYRFHSGTISITPMEITSTRGSTIDTSEEQAGI